MEMVDEFCCICLTPFATTTQKRKRKKFHGASCENSKEILNEISISQTTLPLSSYVETSEKYAYLCHHCHSQTDKIIKLREELLSNMSDFGNKISALHKCDTISSGVTPLEPCTSSKRPIDIQDDSVVVQKSPRLHG